MKIEVFVRHCYYSRASIYKARFEGFSHEKCHLNLMETADFSKVNFTYFLDTHFSSGEDHFIKNQDRFPVIEIDAGCEAKSFLAQLEYVVKQEMDEETVIYFLEDDYLHREGWCHVLNEGISLPGVDYVTLFDDRDKYYLEQYETLTSKLMVGPTCHWRTTPATTNTYAMKRKALLRDLEAHEAFSQDRDISADYDKFVRLKKMGATLISPIPGWSTHIQEENMSPCLDWSSIQKGRKTSKMGALFSKLR